VLIELWLALAPERRFTVPPRDKRALAEHAIRETLYSEIESPEVVAVDVDDVLAWSRRHNTAAETEGGPTLRRVRRSRDDDSFNPATGIYSAVTFTLDSANPNVCWTVTDEAIIASAITTLTIPEADCHLVSTTLTIPN
jgi:hypothetical protein